MPETGVSGSSVTGAVPKDVSDGSTVEVTVKITGVEVGVLLINGVTVAATVSGVFWVGRTVAVDFFWYQSELRFLHSAALR